MKAICALKKFQVKQLGTKKRVGKKSLKNLTIFNIR